MSALKKTALVTALMASCSGSAFAFFDQLVVGMTSVTNNLIDSTESVTNNTVNAASTTMLSLSSNPGKMADRIGVMADRIGFMADRIVTTEGIMAGLAHKIIDRTTESRVVPQYASYARAAPTPMPSYYQANGYGIPYGSPYSNAYQPPRPAQVQQISANPYIAAQAAQQAPAFAHGYGNAEGNTEGNRNNYGYPRAQPDISQYSASNMIYGVSGATYTAARPAAAPMQNLPAAQPAYQSGYGFAARPALIQITRTSNTVASNSCGFSYGVPRSC